MRAPGAILLISCYELGHQPLHLASLQGMLSQAGYLPAAVDTAVESLDEETIRRARFVAISVPMHTALRLGEQIARRVRDRNPAATLCFYGLYASLNAAHLLQGAGDSAIGGEYEQPLLQLVAALEEGATVSIPGVSTKDSISVPSIARPAFIMPERQQLPTLERYARLEWDGQARVVGYTETTRGCKHTCLHCPITPVYHGRFFAFPAEVVLNDIRAQVAEGARHITFGDPDFFNGPTHALRIARALHAEFPTLTFDATIKIEHLLKYQQLLPELRSLGCAFVVSAIESLNADVLAHLAKDHSREDVERAFAVMEEAGIPLRPSLLPFSPWETLESYVELLAFFEERHLVEHVDPVHFSIRLLLPPGSSLLDTPAEKPWLGELDAAAYSYRWRHPDPRMDTLHQQVAALVEQAQIAQQDPVLTFFQIKALALQACGRLANAARDARRYGQSKVLPHLSE